MTLPQAAHALLGLVEDVQFRASFILPWVEVAHDIAEPTIIHTFGSQQDAAALQIFLWPPRAASAIHDHACWGAIRCAYGELQEERYGRLDDGAQPNMAHLRKKWQATWRCEDGVTTVLPYEGGIHCISNQGEQVAISVHIYGPRLALFDGRDYDTSRDYVCDRYEPDE
jgi:predicted metal-dependent enzyme (double-stranded beta helix superfamily)